MKSVLAVLTCRYCGADLEQEASPQVTAVVGWLPVRCLRRSCRRHYVVKVELLSCAGDDQTMTARARKKRRYETSGKSPVSTDVSTGFVL